MGKGYGKVLTIVLIVLIIAIVGILGFFAFKIYNSNTTTKKGKDAVAEFDQNVGDGQSTNNNNKNKNNTNSNNEGGSSLGDLVNSEELNGEGSSSIYQTQTGNKENVFEGFRVIGTISIPSIDVEYPILAENSQEALKKAIVAVYPNPPDDVINKPGNLVLWGHNYKDGTFFSNISKLTTGAKVYIKDTTGTKVAYQVYNTYETSDSDIEYARRDTNGAREVTLSTCSNDTAKRTIVWARAIEE